jgi:hypothetical protein
MPMKTFLFVLVALISFGASGQSKKERVPSYFGLQVRPVFPTRFIGESELTVNQDDPESIFFTTTISQKVGYSFGATVRAGLTKLIAIETGINFTQRNFDITMSLPDSSINGTNDISFISYDVPINALFYIRLAEQWYMNASLGVAINFAPTHVGVQTNPIGYHYFTHTGILDNKVGFDLNANIGFEFRTEKSGFFYLGGSGRVPFAPIFTLATNYRYQGYSSSTYGEIDGSFLSIDFKYFFPNIKNKGTQPLNGPIVQ